MPKSMIFGESARLPSRSRDEDVRRLQVAVDDRFLVRVLNAVAYLKEQLEPLRHRQAMLVAMLVDRNALDVVHHEVRPPVLRGSGVEDPSDVAVVHQRQRLSFGLEASDDLARVHAPADELERHATSNRLFLLRDEDIAHAARSQLVDDAVVTDSPADHLVRLAG